MILKTKTFIFITFVFFLLSTYPTDKFYVSASCEETGCYATQSHPCSWISNNCLFQFDQTFYNCQDVPLGSTIDITCSAMNAKSFSIKVLDQSSYNYYRAGWSNMVTYMNVDHAVIDTNPKTFNFVTTESTQNYHLIVENSDSETCASITCTFTTV